jgi:hypothetical protein
MWTFLLALFGAVFFVPGLLDTILALFGTGGTV